MAERTQQVTDAPSCPLNSRLSRTLVNAGASSVLASELKRGPVSPLSVHCVFMRHVGHYSGSRIRDGDFHHSALARHGVVLPNH